MCSWRSVVCIDIVDTPRSQITYYSISPYTEGPDQCFPLCIFASITITPFTMQCFCKLQVKPDSSENYVVLNEISFSTLWFIVNKVLGGVHGGNHVICKKEKGYECVWEGGSGLIRVGGSGGSHSLRSTHLRHFSGKFSPNDVLI